MAIHYDDKVVATKVNIQAKDFTDLRDVNFTNPQDGDVPTWDSTAQKLVNKPAHGIFEVWANPNALQDVNFAGQTIEVESDVRYDGFFFIHGRAGESIGQEVQYVDEGVGSTILWYGNFSMYSGSPLTAYTYTRNVTISYNSTTHKYSFVFGDCEYKSQPSNTTTVSTGTQNKHCAVERILGVIHND